MKTDEIILLDIGKPFSFNNSTNNSGYVEVDFDDNAVVLRPTSKKSDNVSAKELKLVVK